MTTCNHSTWFASTVLHVAHATDISTKAVPRRVMHNCYISDKILQIYIISGVAELQYSRKRVTANGYLERKQF